MKTFEEIYEELQNADNDELNNAWKAVKRRKQKNKKDNHNNMIYNRYYYYNKFFSQRYKFCFAIFYITYNNFFHD